MKKLLCLIALAALCGCATDKTGPNDPLTGNDWNYGPKVETGYDLDEQAYYDKNFGLQGGPGPFIGSHTF